MTRRHRHEPPDVTGPPEQAESPVLASLTHEAIMIGVREYGDAQYRAGVAAGLEVAERIVRWLTRRPDTRRQAETREWAELAIAEARRRHGLDEQEP